MTPQTKTFLSATAQTGVLAGTWFQVKRDERQLIPVLFSISAGTASWEIVGRNSPDDDVVILDSGSADKAAQVPRFAQMRVNLTAATGATFRATADRPMRTVA